MNFPIELQTFLEPWLLFLATDPLLRLLQGAMLLLGVILIFLVFFTARDILLRTHSFIYMCFCILLVAIFPVVGFLLYLLIRPARTIKERELEVAVNKILKDHQKHKKAKSKSKKS